MNKDRQNEILLNARYGRGMVSELNDMEEAAVLVCGLHDRIGELEKVAKEMLNLIYEHGSPVMLAHATKLLKINRIIYDPSAFSA